MMWCEFVSTVHMLQLLLNVSNSTISFYSHPRRLLPKIPNYRSPLFLPISLVHRRQRSSPSQSTKSTHSPHHYSTPSPNSPTTDSESYYARTYAILEIKSKLKIYKNLQMSEGSESDRWGVCMMGLMFHCEWRDFRRIDIEAKNVDCLQSLSLVHSVPTLFLSRFSGMVRYGDKEVITCEFEV